MCELVARSNRVCQSDPELGADLRQLLAGGRRFDRAPLVGSLELAFERGNSLLERGTSCRRLLQPDRVFRVALGLLQSSGGHPDRERLRVLTRRRRTGQLGFERLPAGAFLIDSRLEPRLRLPKVLGGGVEALLGFACRRERVAKLPLQALSAGDVLQIRLGALLERRRREARDRV